MFYSFNLGPAHFVSLNTEAYYYLYYGIHPVIRQYNWLKADLEVQLLKRASFDIIKDES